MLGQSSMFIFLRHVWVPTCVVADKGITAAESYMFFLSQGQPTTWLQGNNALAEEGAT